MRIYSLILFLFAVTHLASQDTLRVMHYNTLYYGYHPGFCNITNNNPDLKDAYLRTILEYVKPDIFTVNEISAATTFHDHVLNEVMNQTSYALYEMSASPNLAGSNIVNMLYYNAEKLVLQSQEVAQDSIRDIDVYRLYSLNEGLSEGDTVFIHCIVAHLKAGDNSTDRSKREVMVHNTLNYLETYGKPGNYLFMGDFNFYKSSEAGFQLMINNNDPVFRFYDPVNEIGNWHINWEYSHVHTQSTHTILGGCPSGGGMDDRFDFIMINQNLYDQSDRAFYLEDSYWALGQDGMRLDGSLLDPPNTSLPAYMLDALYGMSDHLPVIMDLVVEEWIGITETFAEPQLYVTYNNPVTDQLRVKVRTDTPGPAEVIMVSVGGNIVFHESILLKRSNDISIPLDIVSAGMYFLNIKQETSSYTGKVVVLH
ncbi:MAG: T9SS type A sorting domain-containing protein [Bacteroidetes bacterium]|nr:T9SS type A sorting domain-containing protein [Bacteroidota bacterium]